MPGAGACEPLWCVWPILRRVAEHTRTSDVVENIFAGPIIKTQFVSLINSTANLCTRESTKCVNGPLPIAGVQTRQRDCSSNRRIPCHRPQICTVPQAWLRSFPPPCAGSWLALAVANGRGGVLQPAWQSHEHRGCLPARVRDAPGACKQRALAGRADLRLPEERHLRLPPAARRPLQRGRNRHAHAGQPHACAPGAVLVAARWLCRCAFQERVADQGLRLQVLRGSL